MPRPDVRWISPQGNLTTRRDWRLTSLVRSSLPSTVKPRCAVDQPSNKSPTKAWAEFMCFATIFRAA
eukprot:405308-Prymnesium_polylepis.1